MKLKEVIVIVAAYSSGRYLAPIFNGYGYNCVHIHPYVGWDKKFMYLSFENMFIKDIYYNDDINDVLNHLKDYNIKFVVAGSEIGVPLADLIIHKLKLPFSNSIELSKARRNKFLMQQAIKNRGLSSIKHFISNNYDKIIKWIKNYSNYPVVVKPVSGSDAEAVKFCYSDTDVEIAFKNILNSRTLCGDINSYVLVEEKLVGQEYVVNTVSYEGKHIITDVWLSHKKIINKQSVYDYQELLCSNSSKYFLISKYIKKTLNALGIKFGAAHSELILVEGNPVLIETGARLSGGLNPSLMMDTMQYSQLSVLVDYVFMSKKFFKTH